jgi:hypothetical protein
MTVQLAFRFSQRPLTAFTFVFAFYQNATNPYSARLTPSPNNITFEASIHPALLQFTTLITTLTYPSHLARSHATQSCKIQKFKSALAGALTAALSVNTSTSRCPANLYSGTTINNTTTNATIHSIHIAPVWHCSSILEARAR